MKKYFTFKNIGKIVGMSLMAKIGYVSLSMKNFSPSEFGLSLPFVSYGLLGKLQIFRDLMKEVVIVSPAAGSIVRFDMKRESQHNFGRAIDVMIPSGNLKKGFDMAVKTGFTGIGLYPNTKPYPMIHLDIRNSDKVATWSALKKDSQGNWVYGGVNDAIVVSQENSGNAFLGWLGSVGGMT